MKSLTKQRQAVLDVIVDSKNHLTANEVFENAKRKLPTISFATVYNSLRFLKENGYIGEIAFANGASKFDRMTERHDHAVCTVCGHLIDLDVKLPESVVSSALSQSQFDDARIELTLRGTCKDCSK